MKRYNRVCVIVILGILAGMFIAQSAAFADDGRLYGSVGGGVVIFNPPEKDSLPFYESDNSGTVGAAGRIYSPIEFEPDDTAAAWNIAFGYRIGDPQPDGWLGSNFRFEFSTNFYFPDDSTTNSLAIPWMTTSPVGITLGAFYNNHGFQGATPLGGSSPVISDAASVRFNTDYDFIDFLINIRNDYVLKKDVITLSPYAGLALAFFDQDFSYSARSPDSLIGALALGGTYNYNAKEDLDSWYAGLTLGADFVFAATPELSFSLGGSFTPLYADNDMDLSFWGDQLEITRSPQGAPIRTIVPVSTSVDDTDDDWTFRAGAKASMSYRINWFEMSLTGIVDYWDAVPVVEYPEYTAGAWTMFPVQTVSNKVPEIDYDHMTNYSILLNATFYFM